MITHEEMRKIWNARTEIERAEMVKKAEHDEIMKALSIEVKKIACFAIGMLTGEIIIFGYMFLKKMMMR